VAGLLSFGGTAMYTKKSTVSLHVKLADDEVSRPGEVGKCPNHQFFLTYTLARSIYPLTMCS
jgi:hypothetical protein